jgi:voltage-gated potassium channel Kch
VIDRDTERLEKISGTGHRYVVGDATDEDILIKAGIARASTLASVLPSDAANVLPLNLNGICCVSVEVYYGKHLECSQLIEYCVASSIPAWWAGVARNCIPWAGTPELRATE